MNRWNEVYPSNLQDLIEKCERLEPILKEKIVDSDCPIVADLYELRAGRCFAVQENWTRAVCFDDQAAHRAPFKEGEEFKGLYAFREQGNSGDGNLLYLGISRNVQKRIRQHGWGNRHSVATLAYLMARTKLNYEGRRDIFDKDELKKQQEIIQKYQVAVLLEPNDYDLYFMEVYFAAKWKTPWNSFRTH